MKTELIIKGIFPFTIENAKHFVKLHENIFNDKTIRRLLYAEENLIIIEETGYFKGERTRWYWCFYPDKYIILKPESGEFISKEKIIEKAKNWKVR